MIFVMKFSLLASVVFLFTGCAALLGSNNGITAAGVNDSSLSQAPTPGTTAKTLNEITFTDGEWDGKEVVKTEEEWKDLVTPDEFAVRKCDLI